MILTMLFTNILKMSIIASFAILIVMAARLALKKFPKIFSYVLWSVVLFRLLCPVSFSGPFSMLSVADFMQRVDDLTVGNSQVVFVKDHDYQGETFYFDLTGTEEVTYVLPPEAMKEEQNFFFQYGAVIWILGMLLMLSVNIYRIVQLKRKLKDAVLVEDNIYETSTDTVPFVFGLVHPRIYLPKSLKDEERNYILMHEKTHIRRCDHIVKTVAFAALTLHWFNPLVWLAFYLAEKDMEMSCDEAVMKKSENDIRAEYSEALLGLATGKRMLAGMPLAFGEGDTKDRVKNVMKYHKPALIISMAAILIVATSVVVLAANPKMDISYTETENTEFITEDNASAEVIHHTYHDYQPDEMNGSESFLDKNTEFITEDNTFEETVDHAYLSNEATENSVQVQYITECAQKWADAFCSRDGNAIIAMSDKKVQDALKENDILRTEGGRVEFGWSSPWPMFSECLYEITVTGDDSAEIRYYAAVSDPHVTVWREKLKFKNDTVVSEELVFYDSITSIAEYHDAYPFGLYQTPMDYHNSNLGEALDHHVKTNRKDSDFYENLYEKLSDPEQAVLYLLNISPDDVKTSSVKLEDGSILVNIHFSKDDGIAGLHMIAPYGNSEDGDSIWVVENEPLHAEEISEDMSDNGGYDHQNHTNEHDTHVTVHHSDKHE